MVDGHVGNCKTADTNHATMSKLRKGLHGLSGSLMAMLYFGLLAGCQINIRGGLNVSFILVVASAIARSGCLMRRKKAGNSNSLGVAARID